jgi:POLO box duplicated region
MELSRYDEETSICPLHESRCPSPFQLNFSDHQKIVLCPFMQAVTLLDVDKNFRTYRFDAIAKNGCTNELYQKLRYAHEKLVKLIEKLSAECY